jgi:hypothetical protein
MAAKYQTVYKDLAMDPSLGGMFGQPQRYALITDGMKAAGFDNWSAYIAQPSPQTAPQPNPKDVADAQAKGKMADAAITNAQANAMKVAHAAEMQQMKEQIAELSMHLKTVIETQSEHRKDIETANKINISQREMALAEAAPAGTETDVVAPRG